MYKFIRKKKIKVNRKRAEIGQTLNVGDSVELFIPEEFLEKEKDGFFKSVSGDISVVYEDENILLCDKKPGMIVHSDENEEYDTLINHIKAYLVKKGEYDPENENSFAPALCNRIDRNTGGIVIAAKNAEALRIINEKIKKGEIRKSYLLCVHGSLGEKKGVLKNSLFKDSKNNLVRISEKPVPGSRSAVTYYRVLKEKNGLSLVEATLGTGRTHQIRAQFAHIGHPLLGDGKYGINRDDRKAGFCHQALYSYRISFDFAGGAEKLGYLKGKSFEVDRDNIYFLKLFG